MSERIVPDRTSYLVGGVLLALTALTVAASRVPLGPLNLTVALVIAAVKAALIVLYFMHVRWAGGATRLAVLGAVLWLLLLLLGTMDDYMTRAWLPAPGS